MSYDENMKKIISSTHKTKTSLHISSPQKIAKSKSAFSLPAGDEFSCPGATDACKKDCYAKKGRHVFSNVQSAFARNWKEMQDYKVIYRKFGEIDQVVHFLAGSIPFKTKIFRIHESGDFFEQWYVDAWTKAIKQRKDVSFWAYTRSFHLNFQKMVNTSNMNLWASTDKDNIDSAKKFVSKYKSGGVKHAYGPIESELDIDNTTFVCPATNGKLALEIGACEACGLCVTKNRTKKNVAFLKH